MRGNLVVYKEPIKKTRFLRFRVADAKSAGSPGKDELP